MTNRRNKKNVLLQAASFFSIFYYLSIAITKTVTSWADAQTAQIISFAILLLIKLWQLCKNCKRHAYIMPKIPINE